MKLTNILSYLLLAAMLCACGDSMDIGTDTGTAEADETTAAVTEKRWLDDLPEDLDFGGKVITIHSFTENEVGITKENGDVLNDIVYQRDQNVEERLNVDLNVQFSGGWETYGNEMTLFRSSIAAGDNAWQLIAGWGLHTTSLALENCYLNLNTLEYLDLSKPWWNQAAVEGCEILDKLYFATGDIAFYSLFGSSYVMFINNTLCSSYEIPSIPDLVRAGTWTIDKMSELAKNIKEDLNGDSVMDEHDQYGYVTDLWNSTDSFYTSADIHQILTKDGLPVYVSQEERISALMEKIYPFYSEKGQGYFYTPDATVQINMFLEGRALIIPRELSTAMTDFRTMEDEFTIVPFPKLDEAQENYLTSAHNGAALWAIPSDNPDPNTAAAVMEALASEAYQTVMPVFYETCLQDKYARNEETVEMLKLIRETAYVDAEMLMHKMFGSPLYVIANQISAQQNNTASYMAKNIKIYESSIENVISIIESME